MSEQRGGFLVEASFVAAVVGIVAAAAVPRILQGSQRANEQLAIATLQRVAKAQKFLRNLRAIDCDNDRRGENGFFGELIGSSALRIDECGSVGNVRLQPPLLPPATGRVVASHVLNHGYVFQIFLPDTNRQGVAEAANGGAGGSSICADWAEQFWCCYAWPTQYGSTGKRVFFINNKGRVLAAANTGWPYSGTVTVPMPSAAFLAGTTGSLDCRTAADTIGVDGQRWSMLR